MRDVREAVPYARILIRWLLRADVGIIPYAGEVERRGRSASPNIKYVYADIHITLVRVANGCEQ